MNSPTAEEDYTVEGKEGPIPTVSVVLPTFRSSKTVKRAVDSIIAQTFTDWEMIVINDYGSDDGTAEIIRGCMKSDDRIRLIQLNKRYGLAESLNLGIRLSRGRYVARMDSDDVSKPKRFEKQVRLLDGDESTGICGTWQKHVGSNEWLHRAAADDKVCRARLLFWCDLCHSTLMLRKEVFLSNGLFYDSNYKAEDYELWTRAMEFTRIRNIPEVLGIYSEGEGITNSKLDELSAENGIIVANTLRCIFGIELDEQERSLFSQWNYTLEGDPDREKKLRSLEEILRRIWGRNQELKSFDDSALIVAISNVWYKSRFNSNIGDRTFIDPKRIDDVFNEKHISSKIIRYRVFRRRNSGIITRLKGLLGIMLGRQ